MTREEAIRTIENAKHFAYDAIYEEAFDMAMNMKYRPSCGARMDGKE